MVVDRMKKAVELAKKAYDLDEIPVGCVIYCGNEIVGCGYNQKEKNCDAISHAEILAISEACRRLKRWRLDDCCLYVTLEPCMMCMGAIIESRIKMVYYGTKSNGKQMYDKNTIKTLKIMENVNDTECSMLLSNFFEKKRKK